MEAAVAYNIDLKQSWVIDDDINDIEAGINAGCKTAYLVSLKKGQADITASSLFGAVNRTLERKEETIELESKLQKHVDLLIKRYPVLEKTQKAIIEAYLLMESCEAFAQQLIEMDRKRGKKLSKCLQGAFLAIALMNHSALNSAYLNDADGELCYAQQVYG